MPRIIFMGAPEFAVPALIEIAGAGHEIVAVYTQPPRPAGRRGLETKKTAVHSQAESLGLRVETPLTLKAKDAQETFRGLGADVAVVVAYGLLLPLAILDIPKYGCLNFHPSMLPRWRGAAPLHRTIMAGDRETAACVMAMDAGLDTGPICLREIVPVSPDMTTGELHDLMARLGGDLLVRALAALARGTLDCTPQSECGVTYAAKIDKAEARIDWSKPADQIHNLVRGLAPFPGAWFELTLGGKTERVKVLRSALVAGEDHAQPGAVIDDALLVACGCGFVRLLELQRSGRKAVLAPEFLRGVTLSRNSRLN